MGKYITIALLLALCGALGLSTWLYRQNVGLSLDNARLERSIAVLEDSAAQSRDAADVAKAERDRLQSRVAELDAIRDTLINGEQDADLPTWFRIWLDGLLGRL